MWSVRFGPVRSSVDPVQLDIFWHVFSVFWSVQTGPTGPRTDQAKKTRPRTGPNVVGPVRSDPVGFVVRSGPSGPFAHPYADIVLLQFLEDGNPVSVSSCGLRLMYEGNVVDSKLVLHNVTKFTSPILLGTTNLITQLNGIMSDDDEDDY